MLGEPEGATSFKELRERASEVNFGNVKALVASINDLISMKRAAGRPHDLANIAELESIKKLMSEEQGS